MAASVLICSSTIMWSCSLSLILFSLMASSTYMMAVAQESSTCCTLETVRQFLTSQEDTIVYRLIDRAKFPLNSPIYNQTFELQPGSSVTLIQFVVRETEIAQAKAGRYLDPQENPFFPDNLPSPITPLHKKYPEFLHPPAASVNVNQMIWDFYFDQFLPTLVTPGDDGHYAATSASDTECLQALSKRIHYGKYVAEVKYREAPHEYEPLIRSKDSEGLMNLLTFKKQEEMVMKRVEKKGMVLGQYVSLNDTAENSGKYKIDPSLVSQLYEKWVMPLTKRVQVDYLLKRLD